MPPNVGWQWQTYGTGASIPSIVRKDVLFHSFWGKIFPFTYKNLKKKNCFLMPIRVNGEVFAGT